MNFKKEDFIYCESCGEFVDFYAYDYSLEMSGHSDCKSRAVTDKELEECISECREWGCSKDVRV